MIRQPERVEDPTAPMILFSPPMSANSAIVVSKQGHRIATYYLQLPRPKYTIIYSHGNAVDIGGMGPSLVHLSAQLNCSILAYDYSGYGISSGKAREKNQYRDIDAVWDHLVKTVGVDPSKIILCIFFLPVPFISFVFFFFFGGGSRSFLIAKLLRMRMRTSRGCRGTLNIKTSRYR
jgi:hypothetical protein